MTRFCLGGHQTDDMACKCWVESAAVFLDTIGAIGTVCGHDDDCYSILRVVMRMCQDTKNNELFLQIDV